MLDLAISIDADERNATIIETNGGVELKAPDWPHDCDFQLVAFDPTSEICEVISAEGLAEDIGEALMALETGGFFLGPKPDWYLRLERCSTPKVFLAKGNFLDSLDLKATDPQ